eukprot:CAMPEP_0201285864 /NCGR_PEP_ID=MMETSP1317-20130820/113940_1 /ASSEMBLY_ACC=CAM_ASM_000770 /TAXON_ID=187299 /ORGANISM="Undescribed Undescribed, Strain Undescribed" /LENGTH=147 /DNA_ID=CAMNT_0047611973 /DNA_START=1389 /DNA_END=1828 /DNA_ORIENTATION=+
MVNSPRAIEGSMAIEGSIMKKVIISVLGPDKPGILAAVSNALFEQNCNIENVSQTILQSEFAGIFVASIPDKLSAEVLNEYLNQTVSDFLLQVRTKYLDKQQSDFIDSEPFIISIFGPDRKGLVAAITSIIARHGVNITNMQAIFKG